RIVLDFPLSPLAGDAKNKLVAFGVPVPQPDPKALAWMQAEQNAPRQKPGKLSTPLALVTSGPRKEKYVAAQTGPPQLQPDTESNSLTDILTGGGGGARMGGAGGTPSANTAVVEVATPGTGASGGSTVEAPSTDTQPGTTDPNAPPTPDSTTAPAGGAATDPNGSTVTAPPATDATQNANGQTADATKTDASQSTDNKGKESTSKKKKGLKKIIPW